MSTETNSSDYLVKLKKRFLLAERTMAFQFEKPAGFTFRPGQRRGEHTAAMETT